MTVTGREEKKTAVTSPQSPPPRALFPSPPFAALRTQMKPVNRCFRRFPPPEMLLYRCIIHEIRKTRKKQDARRQAHTHTHAPTYDISMLHPACKCHGISLSLARAPIQTVSLGVHHPTSRPAPPAVGELARSVKMGVSRSDSDLIVKKPSKPSQAKVASPPVNHSTTNHQVDVAHTLEGSMYIHNTPNHLHKT